MPSPSLLSPPVAPGHPVAPLVILGVDPAMAETGYAILRDGRLIGAGKITTTAGRPEPLRVWSLYRELLAVIREFAVTDVAVETFTAFYTNKQHRSRAADQVAALLGQAPSAAGRGPHDRAAPNPGAMFLLKAAQTASQLAALTAGCRLSLYPVAEWKGGLRVTKDTVRAKARVLYGLTTRNHNVTDAAMIAHHHLVLGQFRPDRQVQLSAAERIAWGESLALPTAPPVAP